MPKATKSRGVNDIIADASPTIMPALEWEDDYEPIGGRGRAKEPNPFEPVVKQLALSFDEIQGRSLRAIKFPLEDGKGRSDSKLVRQFGQAARDLGYSGATNELENNTIRAYLIRRRIYNKKED